MSKNYLEPTRAAGKELFTRGWQGEVIMLNLLRFRKIADYSQSPDLQLKYDISGIDAYQLYIDKTKPLLEQRGGELIMQGTASHFFIGPSDESWDLVMLVKQRSLQDFLAFASDPAYQKILGHRIAAIADSRLLPLQLL